ncbi:MAG: hypothetical protein NVSMB46_02290 [Candidatus Saccharimonadales bacterium]
MTKIRNKSVVGYTQLFLSTLSIILLGCTPLAVVYAEGGISGSGSGSTSTSYSTGSDSTSSATSTSTTAEKPEISSTDKPEIKSADVKKQDSKDVESETEKKDDIEKDNSCKKHQEVVSNIMSRIADRGEKQLAVFDAIATRTEAFYTEKGKTLANYSELLSVVTANRAVAVSALATVKADKASFTCTQGKGKGIASAFKTDLQTEITALKDYRTAVKNLVVGVKSVESTENKVAPTTTGGQQ